MLPSLRGTAFCTRPFAKTLTGSVSQTPSLSINGSPSLSTTFLLASGGTSAALIVLGLPVTGSVILTGLAALENSFVMALSCPLLTPASNILSALSIFFCALFTAVCACFLSLAE